MAANKKVRRISMDDSDFERRSPEHLVLGAPDEKPARVHAPLPPKKPRRAKRLRQPVPDAAAILESIEKRMRQLAPAVTEERTLTDALTALEAIDKPRHRKKQK